MSGTPGLPVRSAKFAAWPRCPRYPCQAFASAGRFSPPALPCRCSPERCPWRLWCCWLHNGPVLPSRFPPPWRPARSLRSGPLRPASRRWSWSAPLRTSQRRQRLSPVPLSPVTGNGQQPAHRSARRPMSPSRPRPAPSHRSLARPRPVLRRARPCWLRARAPLGLRLRGQGPRHRFQPPRHRLQLEHRLSLPPPLPPTPWSLRAWALHLSARRRPARSTTNPASRRPQRRPARSRGCWSVRW